MPPPASRGGEQQRVCYFFLKGTCKFGDRCRKKHVRADQVVPEARNTALRSPEGVDTETRTQNVPEPMAGATADVRHPNANANSQGQCECNICLRASSSPDASRAEVGFIPLPPPNPSTEPQPTGASQQSQTQTSNINSTTTAIPPASRPRSNYKTKDCVHWAKGSCAWGDKCRYRHDESRAQVGSASDDVTVEESKAQANPGNKRRQAQERRRREAEERGRIAAEETRRREEEEKARREAEEQKRRQEIEKARRAEAAERQRKREEADRRAEQRRLEEEARRQERDRLDAAKTIQHLVLGTTIVKFSAGVNIDNVLTGFDSCRVRISGLPPGAKPHEACNLLRDQGLEEDKFQFVNLKAIKGKKEANFIVEEEIGKVIALGIDGVDFRGQPLTVEASDSGTLEGMNTNNSALLSVSWRLPSNRFVATYLTPGDANSKRSVLNGRMVSGRKIRVENNQFRGVVDPYSLLISGVPPETSIDEIRDLVGTFTMRQIQNKHWYDEHVVEGWVRQHIRSITGTEGGLLDYEQAQLNSTFGNRSMRIRFRTWEDAKRVYDQLNDVKFPCIAYSTFRLWLPDPYQITIPMQQYRAQKKQWDSFVNDTKGKKDSTVHVRTYDDRVVLRVGGDDLKAVGMLKVRVENLVAGIALQDMWHAWFDSTAGKAFLDSVHTATGVFIKCDWRVKVLKAFGDPAAVSRAREMLKEEIGRLSDLEHTETLSQTSIRFFVQRGVDALKEAFGEDSVTLDISSTPVKITIRGGEDARHLLLNLKQESYHNTMTNFSTTSESTCPICLTEVSNPVKLACGHEYCTACIRHFFTADIKNFPIVCVGAGATCMQPIALPMIQKFLTAPQFNALMETAFTSHVENTQMYRYCKTPDCKQIYRCSSIEATTQRCPSCLVAICLKCHEEGHDGMTCEERRIQADPAEQDRLNDAWARQAGVKKCPKCDVWIEKTEGCNHMSCKCGAHICWVCMGTFEAGTIYTHMREVHGGIGLPGDEVQGVDLQAQFQAFEAYNAHANVPRQQAFGIGIYERARREALERQRREREAAQLRALREVQIPIAPRVRAVPLNYTAPQIRDPFQLFQERERMERERRERERQERERQGGWCVVM